MSLKRISAVLFAVGGALGCTTYPTYRPVALDCTLDNGYVLDPVDMTTAFTYGDPPFYGQVFRDSARLNLRQVDDPVVDSARRDAEHRLSATITGISTATGA